MSNCTEIKSNCTEITYKIINHKLLAFNAPFFSDIRGRIRHGSFVLHCKGRFCVLSINEMTVLLFIMFVESQELRRTLQ